MRDWSWTSSHALGRVGGDEYLAKILEIKDGQTKDLRVVREHISSCFQRLECFLMPYPGRKVACSEQFSGRVADLEPEFREQLREFVEMTFKRDNLCVKQINGNAIKARDWLLYWRTYVQLFNSGGLPEPKTFLEHVFEPKMIVLNERALDRYHTGMEELISAAGDDFMAARALDERHELLKAQHLEPVEEEKERYEGQTVKCEIVEEFWQKFERGVNELLQSYHWSNDEKIKQHNDKLAARFFKAYRRALDELDSAACRRPVAASWRPVDAVRWTSTRSLAIGWTRKSRIIWFAS